MKKIFVLFFVSALTLSASAQLMHKRWSVIPRVGLNLSNLGDMTVFTGFDGDNYAQKPKALPDVMAGAEFNYRIVKPLSVGIGAYYSRQGCHFKSYSNKSTTSDPEIFHIEGIDKSDVNLQYINIPVTGTLHVTDNIALKLGVQCGVYLSGKWVNDVTFMDVKGNETLNSISKHNDPDLDWACAKTVWSIPVGVEFEYKNVLIDVSYAFPVNGFCKKVSLSKADGDFRMSNGRNKVVTFSVGYRL